ncbi:MAG: LicD family protein [Solobacterium sp.]|nr:LicD family protein [Solobacterium sp.]
MDIRRLHEAQLDTLKDIAAVCEKYHIRYALYCGTLLGAVRHKGFIPWDDDIDVVIPLPDYYTFQDVFPREMGEKYLTETYHSVPKSNILWTKINRRHTTYVSEKMLGHEMDWGISVDIYPMIGAADSALGLAWQKFLIQTAKVMVWTEFERHAGTKYRGWQKIGYLTYALPRGFRHWVADRIMSRVMIDPGKTRRISTIDGAHFDAKYTHEMWDTMITGDFEGESFRMPAEYDTILRIMYGEYMTLPPEEERIVHFKDHIVFSLYQDSDEIRAERKTEPAVRTSVLLRIHNNIDSLKACLDSILAQSQKEMEVILVEDGAGVECLELCREYTAKYPCITWAEQPQNGQESRHHVLDTAKGRYVYFMDSQDTVTPDLFEKCYQTCEERHLDFAVLHVPETSGMEDRNYSGAEYWELVHGHGGISYEPGEYYIRKDFLQKNCLYFREGSRIEDDWFLRLYIHGQNLYGIPEKRSSVSGEICVQGMPAGDLRDEIIRTHDALQKIGKEYPQTEFQKMTGDVMVRNVERILCYGEDMKVVIYGTGIVSKRFLDRYRQKYGKPRANLIFMNTKVTENTFEEYPVIALDQIRDYHPDVVIIASTRYKDEMIQSVHQVLGQVRYCCVY